MRDQRRKNEMELLKKRRQDEENKRKKKDDLISNLLNVQSELCKENTSIQSCIDLTIKEHAQKLEEQMRSFAIDFRSNPSRKPPPFQIDESFTELLSVSKPRLEEISEQMKFIDEFIKKVSSDSPDISISEREKKIIEILSAKSFFRSQDVASVQKMIDFCSNMREYLEHLKSYLNTFLSNMAHEIRIHNRNQDFNVDSKMFELEHKNLNDFLQELSKLNEEIEKSNFLFSKKTLFQCIFFIEFDEFSSIFECTQQLKIRIKKVNGTFYTIKKSFVEFFETQINYRKDFVYEVHSRDCGDSSDNENDSNRVYEPTRGLRERLEKFLNQIKCGVV